MPRLYVILDAGLLTGSIEDTTEKLIDAGVLALQYRNKKGSAREVLSAARKLAGAVRPRGVSFFVNDRADIAQLSGSSGVHVGQEDLGVEQARAVVGAEGWIGVSTHNEAQFRLAIQTSADYIAVGPVFGTTTKENPDPVVGTELIRRVRMLTKKPIVGIGGITLERAAKVIEAGADSVAVISDILRAEDPAQRARQFIRRLEAVKPTVSH
ncbi:MAG TPA: thiamine phosphate synthase [Candidatus Acidoferrum sp.]